MKSNHTTADRNNFYADLLFIECGLGSALAIFEDCEIVIPENHPDPGAITDCKKNVSDAYNLFRKRQTLLAAAPEMFEMLKKLKKDISLLKENYKTPLEYVHKIYDMLIEAISTTLEKAEIEIPE